jgi:hypothetical protein
MPDEVSTCGAKQTSGFSAAIVATTSSIGAGANGAHPLSSIGRAFNTVEPAGMFPISKICVQRKLNQPLRMTRQFLLVAKRRATASIA